MALYNMIVFVLLCFEMGLFVALILPLPFTWRRAMFKFISESPVVAKLQYGLKILFIFVAVLFVDALQHMIKIHNEIATAKHKGAQPDMRSETDIRSRKFLSERNMYLTGFTLFLSLILSRTYTLIMDLIKIQEDYANLKQTVASGSKGQLLEESRYKKQISDLQKEYDALSDKYNALTADAKTNKKSD